MSTRCDVVIPVFNAPDLVRSCIDSLYGLAGRTIGSVHVEDDASAEPTRGMLRSLDHPRLAVHSASRNTGFGASVNRGVQRTDSAYVLVLNSDVEAVDDFVRPLAEALDKEPRLAAIAPVDRGGREMASYCERSDGYVRSYALYGYAFLMRREAFEEVGGFDLEFGRGYFEDLDLARRWLRSGWRLGVHPEAFVEHVGKGSFQQVEDLSRIRQRNRDRYFRRYPEAERRILLVTPEATRLSAEVRPELEAILRSGGGVDWLHGGGNPRLPALPMRHRTLGAWNGPRVLRRVGRHRRHFSEVWIDPAAPWRRARAIERAARGLGIPIRETPLVRRAS